MQSRAHAVAMIGAGSLQLTLDQTAWSLSGILIMGICTCTLCIFIIFICISSSICFMLNYPCINHCHCYTL